MRTSEELSKLREGSMIDYNMRTWEVTGYDAYDDSGWPADVWRLENRDDVLFLEHEYDDGDVFRVARPARLSEITVRGYHGVEEAPFLTAVRADDAPGTIWYQGDEYVLAEEDARVAPEGGGGTEGLKRASERSRLMGVCTGVADYLAWPPAFVRLGTVVGGSAILAYSYFWTAVAVGGYVLAGLVMSKETVSTARSGVRTHYWVYEMGERFVALECRGDNDWTAYAGREAESYEFDNILPGGRAE